MKTGTPPLPPSLFRDGPSQPAEPNPEPQSPRFTREQFHTMNREQRRILTRLMRSSEGLDRDQLARSLNAVMSAAQLDYTLTNLLYQGYVRVNRERRLTAAFTEPEDVHPRPLAQPTKVVYVINPTPNPAPPQDIYRELASGPHDPSDPLRRRLFSLSR
jgi:hypothetical protein